MKLSDLTTEERDRISAAMHECGHAVAAVLAGGRIESVQLHTGDTRGSCTTVDLPASSDAAVTYAGPWCEARWRHGPDPDLSEVRAVLAGSTDERELSLSADGLPRAIERDLEVCWRAVAQLASALWADRTLTHAQVCAALGLPEVDGHRSVAAAMIRSGFAPHSTRIVSPE